MYQYHKWLRSFHAVASTGSFTQAAQLLSIGQPTISEQVSGLEKRFSVELFHRRGRFIELSKAGRQLYDITQGLFGQEDEALQLLQSFQQRKQGMLRIGAVSPPIAMSLTYELMQHYPQIELETSFSSEAGTLERLYSFDIDLAILALSEFDHRLSTRLYRACPILAVVRDDHPWAQQASVSVKEIANQPVVLREPASRTRQLVEEGCRQYGVSLECAMQLNSREAIVHAVVHGIGVGFVSAVEHADRPGTRSIAFAEDPFHISYFLCCLAIRRKRPIIAELFDSLTSN
ncbi:MULTISPECIES: LysR substrate-binding domain-containing protein [unclassified Pseudomonas]|jgi:aminoethylphosphonate catabolism LysR family transcriptional regulator|uniref:LysR substrate-binding domain-containing protein n=1 Tax=unclassified Pseudomonas TaxID=196821 RepID=UPI001AE41605|nr:MULTISPECIES: LysR substrate-binding domain-containing protein [unclassified Pseudomonas]MBP2271684.1 aminoethylphosphonate catabolism LysR family transcriptional regulator [Pseudomonas sp. BP6]MBP2289345.1 aminoethylphosphonate catabolism LysR family transcriptional regulator [Pseudomonas sp. BP7]HDS1694904.1 LysR family transcriptional regulator [Pseudomonas putida]HDS1700074.1 LysR family transcriptional regulator [Pseudomonas putida]